MLKAESSHKPYCGLDRTFLGTSETVRRNIHDVMSPSGQYHVTPELGREMRHVVTGIDHIRLDHDFLRSSREWGNKWSVDEANRDKQGAIRAMQHAAGTTNNIKTHMNSGVVSSLQENQVRANQAQAVTGVRDVQKDMAPYAHQSADRVRQFCDFIGATDRYTGYRNNLSRGSRDPVRLGQSWADGKTRNSYNGSLNVGWQPGSTVPQRGTIGDRTPATYQQQQQPATRKSIQEQCGIQVQFPGRSETTDRFTRPTGDRMGPGYIVNPIPDFRMNGRDLGQPLLGRSRTEYQARYEFPDGSTITKLPWLRQ